MIISFIIVSLVSMFAIGMTSVNTYEILRWVRLLLPRRSITPRLRVLLITVPVFAIHIINIWLYAGIYVLVEHMRAYGVLIGNINNATYNYQSFIERLYFSASTYTALGMGDIRPTEDLRMLACTEVLNGLMMIGWTISFTYLTVEKFWSDPHHIK